MIALSLLFSAAALAQAQAPAARAVAWPAPPEPARIRYVRSIEPASVRPRRSWLVRMARAIAGAGDEPTMTQPYGVTIGSDRRIYVADTVGGVIHVFDLEKTSYSTLHLNFESLIGIASLNERLFVTDSASGRVAALDLRGRALWIRGRQDGFERPTGIAASPDRLYVTDTLRHRVVILNTQGAVVGGFGEHGSGPGQFNFPTNITRSADGRVFVTDAMNFRVQVFDADGRFLRAFGRLGDGAGDFDKPKGVAIDRDGHVYVVEGFHDVVQIFDADGRVLLVFGGSGQGAGELWLPAGMAIANDIIYVVDSANRRVQMYERVVSPR
jgi:DNA-binding beta-propeller fold protein YncE